MKQIKIQGHNADGQWGCFICEDQLLADVICEQFFETWEQIPCDVDFTAPKDTYMDTFNMLRDKYKNKLYLDKEELAGELGISKHTVNHRLYKGGQLPRHKKNGEKVQFPLVEVARFLTSDMIEAKPKGWDTKRIFGKEV